MLYGQVAVAIENLSTTDWQSCKEHHRKSKVLVKFIVSFRNENQSEPTQSKIQNEIFTTASVRIYVLSSSRHTNSAYTANDMYGLL